MSPAWRVAEPPGDRGRFRHTDVLLPGLTPEWGMHLVDANVAMGNIEDVVATQAEVHASRG